jgi:hypothetical protein
VIESVHFRVANFRRGAILPDMTLYGAFQAPRLAVFLLALASVLPANGQDSSQPNATGKSRADLFIEAFGPLPAEPSLRASKLEMEEKVRLAFYGIDATRVRVERGELTPTQGAETIQSFVNTISNFVHDCSNDALILASAGRVADLPVLRPIMSRLLSVARNDALMGREELALKAQNKCVEALKLFSSRLAETCEEQNPPIETVLAIARQNAMLGTGIDFDLMPCANRTVSATLEYTGVRYRFETCTLSGYGIWKLKISGAITGDGSVEFKKPGNPDAEANNPSTWRPNEGLWKAFTTYNYRGRTVKDKWVGEIEIVAPDPERSPRPQIAVPNDAGPNARPNGWPKEPVPRIPMKHPLKVGTFRMHQPIEMGKPDGYRGSHVWIEAPIVIEPQTCKTE